MQKLGFNNNAEMLNGRLAMLGFVAALLTEIFFRPNGTSESGHQWLWSYRAHGFPSAR
jgi:hypothetical protein